jgi:hypothetical protein
MTKQVLNDGGNILTFQSYPQDAQQNRKGEGEARPQSPDDSISYSAINTSHRKARE